MICPNCMVETRKENRTNYKNTNSVWDVCAKCGFTHPGGFLRIDEVFVFAVVDKNDQEGIPAIDTPMGPMPLIAADKDRLAYLRPIAKDLARKSDLKIKLLRFSTREEVESFY